MNIYNDQIALRLEMYESITDLQRLSCRCSPLFLMAVFLKDMQVPANVYCHSNAGAMQRLPHKKKHKHSPFGPTTNFDSSSSHIDVSPFASYPHV